MPLTQSEILDLREAGIDGGEFRSLASLEGKLATIDKNAERLKQHLRNPNCAMVIVQLGSDDLQMSCNIPTAARGDQPMLMLDGPSSKSRIQPVNLADKGSGGKYERFPGEHMAEHGHIDDDSMAHIFTRPYDVTYQDKSMNMSFVQRRYQGVTILTQNFHDEKEPDLFGWALMLQIVDPGALHCNFVNVLFDVESGNVQCKDGSFSTPRWRAVKLLDFDRDLASAFDSGRLPNSHWEGIAAKRQRLFTAASAFAELREKEVQELENIDAQLTKLWAASGIGDTTALALEIGGVVCDCIPGFEPLGVTLNIAGAAGGAGTFVFEKVVDGTEESKLEAIEKQETDVRNEFLEAKELMEKEVKEQTGSDSFEVLQKVLFCKDAEELGHLGELCKDLSQGGEEIAEGLEFFGKVAIVLSLVSIIHHWCSTPPTQEEVRAKIEEFKKSLSGLQQLAAHQ